MSNKMTCECKNEAVYLEIITTALNLLEEYTSWNKDAVYIDPVKPLHGSCCTCQDCGQHVDDCVCESNTIVTALEKFKSKIRVV